MIIDLHAHLGEDVVFDEEQTEEELITAYQENHVGGAIVQPYLPRIYMEDHRQIHDRIHRLCQESKEVKFWGMASINPHFRPEDYDEEAQRSGIGICGNQDHAHRPCSASVFQRLYARVGSMPSSQSAADDSHRGRNSIFRSHQCAKSSREFSGCSLRSGSCRFRDAQSAGHLSGCEV